MGAREYQGDSDLDGILDDGDESGAVDDNPCTEEVTADCDDNCIYIPNLDQEDYDGDGQGNVCDDCTDSDGDGYGDPGFPYNTCPLDECPNEVITCAKKHGILVGITSAGVTILDAAIGNDKS